MIGGKSGPFSPSLHFDSHHSSKTRPGFALEKTSPRKKQTSVQPVSCSAGLVWMLRQNGRQLPYGGRKAGLKMHMN